jgi:hypothetical protein
MANFTITLPDAVVPRIRAAFGDGKQPASVADVQAAIKTFIQRRVVDFEAQQAEDSARRTVGAEQW